MRGFLFLTFSVLISTLLSVNTSVAQSADNGRLKVAFTEVESIHLYFTSTYLEHPASKPISAKIDSNGVACFTNIPSGPYTLTVKSLSLGTVKYDVYIESNELKMMSCNLDKDTGPSMCFPHYTKVPMLGSVYGNTSVYTTDRILTSPY